MAGNEMQDIERTIAENEPQEMRLEIEDTVLYERRSTMTEGVPDREERPTIENFETEVACASRDNQSNLSDLYKKFSTVMADIDIRHGESLTQIRSDFKCQVQSRIEDLRRTECAIVISGETSAGKSTLMNALIGHRIFKASNLPTTDKIYRVHNSMSLKLEYYDNEQIRREEIHPENIKDLERKLQEVQTPGYVDVYLPLPGFKGDVVLVDTPGIGYSEEHTNVLLSYITNAVAFVFVVNVANAGGFQEDRLLNLLKQIKERTEKMPCFDLADVLFVLNKMDQVDTDQQEEIILNGRNVILEAWPYAVLAQEHTFHLSLREITRKNSQSNLYREEFERLKKSMTKMVDKNENKRFKENKRYLERLVHDCKAYIDGTIQWLQRKLEVEKCMENVMKDRKNCIKRSNKLSNMLQEKADELAKNCEQYMTSEERQMQLIESCNAEKSLVNPSPLKAHNLLREQCEKQFQDWNRNDEVISEIKSIDEKITEYKISYEKSVEGILGKITGKNSTGLRISPLDYRAVIDDYLERFPRASSVQFSFSARMSWMFSSSNSREKILPQWVKEMSSKYTEQTLAKTFKKIFMVYFHPRITSLLSRFLEEYETIDHLLQILTSDSEHGTKDMEREITVSESLATLSEELIQLRSP